MTASKNQRWNSRGRNSRNNSIPLLIHIDLAVPTAPDLSGSEHSTTTTHISESTLTSTVSTAAGNTGNTGHSTSSTPGFRGGLMAGALADGVGLTAVLRDRK